MLFREAYGPTHPEPTLSTYLAACFSADAVAARLGEPAVSALVVENPTGDWLGYAELRAGPPEGPHISLARPLPSGRGLEIVRFYVARSQHGRGIAQALMEAAEELALSAVCEVIWLQAWQQAPQALRFYQKVGFEVHGTATFAFGTRTDHDYLLVKPLRAEASARRAAGEPGAEADGGGRDQAVSRQQEIQGRERGPALESPPQPGIGVRTRGM